MVKNFSAEELEQALKKVSAMKNEEQELSLDDLESVSGGWSYADSGETMSIDLTEDEYRFLSSVLDNSIAKSFINAYGLEGIQIERHMVVPRDKGEILCNLLTTFMGKST